MLSVCTIMVHNANPLPFYVLEELNQLTGDRCEKFLAPVNDADGTHEFRHIEGNGCNHAILDFAADAGARKNADTGLNRNRLLDGFDIVELHRGLRTNAALT